MLRHYHVVCKGIASCIANEDSHQNKRAKEGQQIISQVVKTTVADPSGREF
jgi:hypothetical protein